MNIKACSSVLSVLLSAVCITTIASAQTGWSRTYGGGFDDMGFCAQQTADSGYIITGRTYSYGLGTFNFCNVYLVKTTRSGDTLWTRTYGGESHDDGRSVQQTADGGYIVAGATLSFGAGNYDVYLVKTSAQGETLWTRTYGGTGFDDAQSVQQTTDGGYIIAGNTGSFGAVNGDIYLVKTNASGDTLWTRTYGGQNYDYGSSVQQTADEGYIIAGYTFPYDSGSPRDYSVYLVRTNASGDTLWTRTYGGGDGRSLGFAARQTADSGYIVTGWTSSSDPWDCDVCLIRLSASGDSLWTRTYGGTAVDEGFSVQQTADGGYILAGYTWSFGAGEDDVFLIRTDARGDTLWTRTYGGSETDRAHSVQQSLDGGYIVAGWTTSFGGGNPDVYVVTTDTNGNMGVADESPEPAVVTRSLGTTILSGASGVKHLASCTAFDPMGRRVLQPKLGIYFVRKAQAQAVRKVLLVR